MPSNRGNPNARGQHRGRRGRGRAAGQLRNHQNPGRVNYNQHESTGRIDRIRGRGRGRGRITLRRYTPQPQPEPPAAPLGNFSDYCFFHYDHYGRLISTENCANESHKRWTSVIAVDCEMVEIKTKNNRLGDGLGRVSLVNEFGYCVYDKFVKPEATVHDYRTEWSGIREHDLQNATPHQQAVSEVARIVQGRVLVGHCLTNDLKVLRLRSHPRNITRDTQPFYQRHLRFPRRPSLKTLAQWCFGITIQDGEHSSITDAQVAMALYRLRSQELEMSLRQ